MKKIINSLTIVAAQQRHKKINTRRNFYKHSVLAISIAGAILPMSPARAGLPPGMEVFDQASEISDSDLGHMRGKFVAAGQVMNFGVEMVTQWQTASGQNISATGNLNVNLTGSTPQVSFRPTITVAQNSPVNGYSSQGTAIVSGGAGLQNVNGVVQNIQVAGTSNGVGNSLGMNIKFSSALPAIQTPSNGSLNTSVVTADGSVATVNLGSNGMSVAVAVPNQGQAIQQIRSVGMGGGQVLQSVQLGGDLNQIHNMINLNVQMSALAPGLASQASNVLQALRMMPQRGLF